MRRAGILLPVFSLPSPGGIGTMGQAARDFLDFLEEGGQTVWQLLPICPTGFGDSPYQSFSSFAGNPYFIDLDDLCREGLLTPEEYAGIDWGDDPGRVDYGKLYAGRFGVLQKAVDRARRQLNAEMAAFCRSQRRWLDEYAVFMALKDRFGGASWQEWPEPLRRRQPQSIEELRRDLLRPVVFWKGVQFLFYRQWKRLKGYAATRRVSLVGDLPIYVAADSADVWAAPDQFQLDSNLHPTDVAGVPPDGFSPDGQLWGNPLFRWSRMRRDGYRWWIRRISHQLSLFDTLRIDHFRGFESYYSVPAGETTARNGRWRQGPGFSFFREVQRQLGQPSIIAEDLGFLTTSVEKLLQKTGFPGMKVLEFAFDPRDTGSAYLPHCYTSNCVAYTGTHDNDTVLGWIKSAPPGSAERAAEYLRISPEEGYHWGMMRGIWASVADLAVVQMQDVLGLGSEARMNIPSTLGQNWTWRCPPGAFDRALAKRLRHAAALYGRLPEASYKTPNSKGAKL